MTPHDVIPITWGLTEIELAVEFLAVDDVEPVLDARLHVRHLEVEPLMVVVGVDVRVQYQIVLQLTHLQQRQQQTYFNTSSSKPLPASLLQ